MCEPQDVNDYPQASCTMKGIAQRALIAEGTVPCEVCREDRKVCNGWPKDSFEEVK